MYGGSECVATVGITCELVERRPRRSQQHRIAGLCQVTSCGNGRRHHANAETLPPITNFCHSSPRNHSSRMHINILACHNVDDGDIGRVS